MGADGSDGVRMEAVRMIAVQMVADVDAEEEDRTCRIDV